DRQHHVGGEDRQVDGVQPDRTAHVEISSGTFTDCFHASSSLAQSEPACEAAETAPVAGSIESTFAGPPISVGGPPRSCPRRTMSPVACRESMTESGTADETDRGSPGSVWTRPALTATSGLAPKSTRSTTSCAVTVTILGPPGSPTAAKRRLDSPACFGP